jgi:hypothetical protein
MKGTRSVFAFTIANDADVSSAVNLGGYTLAGIQLNGFNGNLSLENSIDDGATFQPVAEFGISTPAANTLYPVDPAEVMPLKTVRIKASANQSGARAGVFVGVLLG